MLIPALLTMKSTRPKRPSTSRITRSHSSRAEMSAGTAIDAAAYFRQLSMTSSSRSFRRATAATVAPRRARSVATVAPIPDDAPVTTATPPAMSMSNCLAERLVRPHTGGCELLGVARPEEDALADRDDSGVGRVNERDGVDQKAVSDVANLYSVGVPGTDERHSARLHSRPERLGKHALPLHLAAGRAEGVDAGLLHELVPRVAELAAEGAKPFEASHVPQRRRAEHSVACKGGAAEEASGQSAEHDVGAPDQVSGDGIEAVVRPVLAADTEELLTVGQLPVVGGGTEVPVATLVGARRPEVPRQRPVARVEGEHRFIERRRVVEVAVGHVEHDDVVRLHDRARGPDTPAAVVQDVAVVGIDVGLEAPDLVAVLEVGGGDIAPMAVLTVGGDAEDDLVSNYHRRREDAAFVMHRVGRFLGKAGVVVVPDLLAGVGVEGVQGVATAEDHQVAPVGLRVRRLVPRRRGDESAVRRQEGLGIGRVDDPAVGVLLRGHRRLRLDVELPDLLP